MANTMSNHHFDWFKLADYQVSKRFKLSDWADMLSRRNKWEIELSWYHLLKAEENTKRWPDDLWDPAKVEEDRKRFLDDYLADVLPCNHGARGPEWWPTTTSIRIPAITDITDCFREVGDFEIEAAGAHVLMVDPRAPRSVLIRSLDKLLVEHRKRSPLPAKRRGKPSVNFEITADHIKSWTHYNVLAVLDLDFYAQVFGKRRLSSEKLGNLLERSDASPHAKEWGRNARAKAAEAMRCREVLAAQIQAENSAREGGPK